MPQEQNGVETIEMPLANTGARALTFVVDMGMIVLLAAGLDALHKAYLPQLPLPTVATAAGEPNVDFSYFVILPLMFAYYFISEALTGRTLGKFVARTRVVRREDGERPTAGQVALRTLCRFIPFEYVVYAFSLAGPHDWLSKTLVVEV